jgi:hypothetical protein
MASVYSAKFATLIAGTVQLYIQRARHRRILAVIEHLSESFFHVFSHYFLRHKISPLSSFNCQSMYIETTNT